MGCMSLPLELNAAEGIIAPAGIFALTIFLGNEKKAFFVVLNFKNRQNTILTIFFSQTPPKKQVKALRFEKHSLLLQNN